MTTPRTTQLTQAQIARLHEQLAAASRMARSLPGTKVLREQLHDLIIAETFDRHPGRSAATLRRSVSRQDNA